MRLPLTVRWADDDGIVGEVATEACEVSCRGLYFYLPMKLTYASRIEIVMILPHELTQAGPVSVRCQGRVLRSSIKESGKVGLAVATAAYEFLRHGEM
jgi:hypothetical protein